MTQLFDINAEIQRQRRQRLQKGRSELVRLGDGLGTALNNLYDGIHRLWVRPMGSDDGTGTAGTGAPFSVLAGTGNYLAEINQHVWICWDEEEEDLAIKKPDARHMAATGRAMTLLNPHDAHNQFIRQNNILTLRAAPLGGNSFKIKVEQWPYYRASDGANGMWPGSDATNGTHGDVEGDVPTTNGQHCYSMLCFNIDLHQAASNPLVSYISTPKAVSSPLTGADLAECFAQAYAAGSTPIKAFRLVHGMTGIRGHQDDRDVRQFINAEKMLVIPNGFVTVSMLHTEAFPKAAVMDHKMSQVIAGGDITIDTTTDQIGGRVFQSPAAEGDIFENGFLCRAGTYSLIMFGETSPDSGIATISIDGVEQGAIDWYAASVTSNLRKTLAITLLADGWHVLRITMASKHASSSGYGCITPTLYIQPANY